MITIEKAACWVCGKEYDTNTEAATCEKKGIIVPYFAIGDRLQYNRSLGADRERRFGTVLDILFPMPQSYVTVGHVLTHNYQVSYLVRTETRLKKSESGFFGEENIELLQVARTINVVQEANTFFEDGVYVNESLDMRTHVARRIVVTRWDEYVAHVVRRNQQLKDRLDTFTKELGATLHLN